MLAIDDEVAFGIGMGVQCYRSNSMLYGPLLASVHCCIAKSGAGGGGGGGRGGKGSGC